MTTYSNFHKEDYLSKNQFLSSLILNPPYKVDGFTTSPRISKIITCPFGIKVDLYLFCRSVFNMIFSLVLIMAVACVSIICVYVPLCSYNAQLFDTVKSLTNEKFALLAELQEASSYSKLFSGARLLSLEDPEEIIYVSSSNQQFQKYERHGTTYKEYPSIRFAGF